MNNIDVRSGFSAYQIKIIAITAMLIDHIAWAFVPDDSCMGVIMHIVGRLTAPIMCFFAAEGVAHTRNIRNYIIRMAVFAFASAFAYSFYSLLCFNSVSMGMIYSILLGILSLAVWNSGKINILVKIIIVAAFIIMSVLGDWAVISVLWILFFGIFRESKIKTITAFSVINVLYFGYIVISSFYSGYAVDYTDFVFWGVFLAIPFICMYNGCLGGGRNAKWIFYIFYPLHLLILAVLKLALNAV